AVEVAATKTMEAVEVATTKTMEAVEVATTMVVVTQGAGAIPVEHLVQFIILVFTLVMVRIFPLVFVTPLVQTQPARLPTATKTMEAV
ncbi:hypothetical protein S1OALGB6SA_2042, partial [Olavius algarvensis spirochete endosymbiont]|uniref:hypothetical protein n=1 Tax=Olavius algarvensis spirochete endosymbiont TaxID=260710 RepID=UPI000F14F795